MNPSILMAMLLVGFLITGCSGGDFKSDPNPTTNQQLTASTSVDYENGRISDGADGAEDDDKGNPTDKKGGGKDSDHKDPPGDGGEDAGEGDDDTTEDDGAGGGSDGVSENPTGVEEEGGKGPNPPDISDSGGSDNLYQPGERKVVAVDGSCLHIFHGGSSARANAMNRNHGNTMSCSRNFLINDLVERGPKDVITAINIQFRHFAPPRSVGWTDGLRQFDDNSASCQSQPTNLAISDLNEDFSNESSLVRGEKYAIGIVEFDSGSGKITITSEADGWGRCRYQDNCAACLSDIAVEFTFN